MGQSKKSNFSDYQKHSKEATLQELDEALEHLSNVGLPITMSALAEEMGKSRQALYANYIQEHLATHPLFTPQASQEDEPQDKLNAELELLKAQNEMLSAKLDNLLRKRKELLEENTQLHEKLNEISTKYRKLLGKYQEDMENKITHI